MPIEIKELVIRAVVEEQPEPSRLAVSEESAPANSTAVVERCVREVLRILQRNRER